MVDAHILDYMRKKQTFGLYTILNEVRKLIEYWSENPEAIRKFHE
jgi:hypothetical protein